MKRWNKKVVNQDNTQPGGDQAGNDAADLSDHGDGKYMEQKWRTKTQQGIEDVAEHGCGQDGQQSDRKSPASEWYARRHRFKGPLYEIALIFASPLKGGSETSNGGTSGRQLAMITDARNPPWPLDIRIDHQSAGLKMPSVVRMKFFTLDNRLVIRGIGRLSPVDRQKLLDRLRQVLPPLR
jgi:mRNA interferase MazF